MPWLLVLLGFLILVTYLPFIFALAAQPAVRGARGCVRDPGLKLIEIAEPAP